MCRRRRKEPRSITTRHGSGIRVVMGAPSIGILASEIDPVPDFRCYWKFVGNDKTRWLSRRNGSGTKILDHWPTQILKMGPERPSRLKGFPIPESCGTPNDRPKLLIIFDGVRWWFPQNSTKIPHSLGVLFMPQMGCIAEVYQFQVENRFETRNDLQLDQRLQENPRLGSSWPYIHFWCYRIPIESKGVSNPCWPCWLLVISDDSCRWIFLIFCWHASPCFNKFSWAWSSKTQDIYIIIFIHM